MKYARTSWVVRLYAINGKLDRLFTFYSKGIEKVCTMYTNMFSLNVRIKI